MATTADPIGDKLDKLIAGVTSIASRQDAVEEEAKKKADGMSEFMDSFKKRMDAWEESSKADKARLDAACEKMDAMSKKDEESEEDKKKKEEQAKKDAAQAGEKAKKDAAEADEKAKKDAANGNSALLDRLAVLEAQAKHIPDVLPNDQRALFASTQMNAERVYQAFGDSAGAPHWLNGETHPQYVARLASKWKDHSKDWKSVDLNALPEAALHIAATRIFADALAEATHPTKVRPGVLIPQRFKDAAGREITKYFGDPNACWDQFNPPVRHVRRILTPGTSRVQ